MKLGMKTKLIIAGAGILILLGGVGVLIQQDHSTTASEYNLTGAEAMETAQEKKISPANAEHHSQETLDISVAEAEEFIAFLDELSKADEITVDDSVTVSDDSSEEDAVDKKSDTPERTPEQWRKYELLARLLPRYHEGIQQQIALSYDTFLPTPHGLSKEEFSVWKKDKLVRVNNYNIFAAEVNEIWIELQENFPEAFTTTHTDSGLHKTISYAELRKTVGGPLPVGSIETGP